MSNLECLKCGIYYEDKETQKRCIKCLDFSEFTEISCVNCIKYGAHCDYCVDCSNFGMEEK